MAAIENLEIIVDVDIGSAIAALEDLQQELMDLSESIEAVDLQGTEGINIRTDLDNVDDDLAALKAKMEAFEATNGMNIDVDFDKGRYVIPNWQRSGNMAGNTGELFDFMDFPGRGGKRRGGMMRMLSRNIGKLFDNIDEFDLRMSDMHNMLARLVPLLLVFIGVIPAAITAIVGLAAAAIAAAASLAAIAGFGALGVGMVDGQFSMDRLSEMVEEVRSDFLEAFAPLAERLQPIFEDAIDGLDRFFQAVANQGDALMALTDEARAFGGFLMDFMPQALRSIAGLVEALSPLFAAFGQWLNNNFNVIMRDLAVLTMEATPAIAELVMTIGQAIPWLTDMSIGFAMIANGIIDMVGLFGRLLDLLGISGQLFGVLTGGLLAFATAMAISNTKLYEMAAGALVSAVTGLYQFFVGLLAADSALTYMSATTIGSAIGSIFSFITSVLLGETALFSFSAASFTAAGALAAFMTIATLGAAAALVGVALSAASSFFGLAGSIDSATSSLKDFNRVSGKTGDGFNPYGAGTKGAGAADVGGVSGRSSAAGSTIINIESSGDRQDDKSNAKYASWRDGRTTGGSN